MVTSIKAKTIELIDSLKATCQTYGMGNDGNEYKIITQVFLYKFLNDKFGYELKRMSPAIAAAEKWEVAYSERSEDDRLDLFDELNPDVPRLLPEHLISNLWNQQAKGDFDLIFDRTMTDIADKNIAIFSTQTTQNTKIPLFEPLTQYVTDDAQRAPFARALVDKLVNFSFEEAFAEHYDFFAAIFEYLINPYRSSGGKMRWNEHLKREIPATWNVLPLLEVISWESNSQPPKSEFVYEPQEGYVRFIQNRDYDSNAHKTYIPYSKNLSIVDRYDILMDKYGDAGAVRYGIAGAFNVALGKICVHDSAHREYVRSFLGSKPIYTYLHNSCMASTRASLSEANLSMLYIAIPDSHTVSEYEKMLYKIRSSILKNNDETEKLIELRDWLLPMLMNGQATISD